MIWIQPLKPALGKNIVSNSNKEDDTLTLPVATQERKACTIFSSQRESLKDVG